MRGTARIPPLGTDKGIAIACRRERGASRPGAEPMRISGADRARSMSSGRLAAMADRTAVLEVGHAAVRVGCYGGACTVVRGASAHSMTVEAQV